MRKALLLISVLVLVLFSVSACSNAAEENKPAERLTEPVRPVAPKDMTREMLIRIIEDTLQSDGEIANFIPEIKVQPTPDGKGIYTYHGVGLESLERESLEKILARVRNEAARIRADRLNKQIESIQKAHQNITASQQPFRPPVVVAPPAPPKIPAVPQQPPSAPQIPKTPQLPPAPPKK